MKALVLKANAFRNCKVCGGILPSSPRRIVLAAAVVLLGGVRPAYVSAGELIVRIASDAADNAALVGVTQRWDTDGNPRRAVDPKAVIDRPATDAVAQRQPDGTWLFRQLAPGRYDLVIITKDHLRVEGFHYPPILEFDEFLPGVSAAPEDVVPILRTDIAESRHFENKVAPLFFGGDAKQVRVLVQLVRDEPTSFDAQYGQPVATVRHEFWQYTNRYGGWVKEKRTRVIDRLLMPKREWNQWSWIWDPQLGGIDIASKPVTLDYRIPRKESRK